MPGTDKPIKEGQLHVKQNKFGKKWKRCYVLLYPDSPFGVARLEFYDWKDGTVAGEKFLNRRAADRKIVRLAECVCVAPAPSENGHKENMTAFTLETNDKTILLSTERLFSNEWIQKLSEVAFPNNLNGCKSNQEKKSEDMVDVPLEMAVNSIYVSREEVCEFLVTVQRTEAAERCSLRGSYILRAEVDCLILIDPNTKQSLYSWPYKLLRRYGRDKVMFSFEAGRRCSSGPGNFTFETSQGHEIFQRVESSIRAQQGTENRLSCSILDTDVFAENASHGLESTMSEVQTKNVISRKEPEEKPVKGRTLPNPPMAKSAAPQHLLEPSAFGSKPVVSNTPPRSPVSKSASHHSGGDTDDLVGVYSEPKDSVRGVKPVFDPLYSDPVDSVKGQITNRDMSGVSPLYSDLYEQVGYEVVGVVSPKLQTNSTFRPTSEEHIYDEPEGIAQSSEPPQLYSEVRMEKGAWMKQASDEKLRYEYPYNPVTDDYSVPNIQGQRVQPRNRSGPKPVPAPKPQGVTLLKTIGKEPETDKTSTQSHSISSNSNNNNSSHIEPLYSQIQKPGASSKLQSPANPQCTTSTPGTPVSVPLPTKPPSLPALPLPNKTLPHSVKASGVPGLPIPSKPHVLPPATLPTKPIPLYPQPVTQASQSLGCPEKELCVDENRQTSIYEDMGVL
ncbi:docking protein 1 [Pelobates fuscus]|uniref:docking protein 1 n=1 Tax=Pelobates fuscus TaxID=191477 RepID=UPI002FE49787